MANPKKPPLTDAERHKRFKDMAREVEAVDAPDAFDRAFRRVVPLDKPAPGKSE
ncbi:hypothetical protein [Novosphingobium sp. Gsoil 351]|uniref:hypothetical protein n=1 Tax=Novosphingobium sp. Gsoil 351 TaxID=2675225 RepID=UPI0012B4F790|nr:hypothetical protein [Novosphingobium sp. Gsoil 351]QGN54160.1 hypothetical protein GKE62_05990 [Novosphingobium sp. Gsoil 351]